MSAAQQKIVRFSDQGRRSSYIEDTLTLTRMTTPDQKDESGREEVKPKRKFRNIKKTQLQLLKAEKKSLAKELQSTKKGIKQDSKRKGSEDYTPYENRQRLARTTSELQSRMKQLDSKISTKKKVKKERARKSVDSKVKKKYIRADKQHKRIIKMTGKLERIKLDEENLRAEIARDCLRHVEDEKPPSRLGSARSLASVSSSSTKEGLPVIELGKWKRLSRHETLDPEQDAKVEGNVIKPNTAVPITSVEPTVLLERRRSSTHDKTLRADKLASNYQMTRELRNTIHQHMISRSYSFSYFNIIPPYKRRKPKPQKSKQFFNRKVYEDKIAVADFSRKYGEGKFPVVKT